MNRKEKYLIGFKLEIAASGYPEVIINLSLLNNSTTFISKKFKIEHIKFVESQVICLYCTVEPIEVSYLSRGKDKSTTELMKLAKSYCSDLKNEFDSNFINLKVNPMYYNREQHEIHIYEFCNFRKRQYSFGKAPKYYITNDELYNTEIEMNYYGMYQ